MSINTAGLVKYKTCCSLLAIVLVFIEVAIPANIQQL
jgi:hypothetical protein